MICICRLLFITAQILIVGVLLSPDRWSSTRAQERLTLQELLLRTKEAAGGDALDRVRAIRIRWDAQEGGLNGLVEETDDLAGMRYKDTSDFGVRSGAFGFNGNIVWSQDSSGLSHVEDGSDAREGTVNEAYRRSLVYWYPKRWPAKVEYKGEEQDGGLRFYVLRIVPEKGRPFELWFDPTTYLLSRIIEMTGAGPLKVFFTDYREIENLKVPFLVRVQISNGAENVYRAEEFKVNDYMGEVARVHADLLRKK